jgi:protein tyrosine/serine phosphatase
VTNGLPTTFQIVEFAHVVEDPDNAPLLIHCASANRVGAMWALYRALKGNPEELALEEARTIGLQPNREAAVRKWLAEHVPTK